MAVWRGERVVVGDGGGQQQRQEGEGQVKYTNNNNGGGTRVAANAMARFVLTTNRSTFAAGGGAFPKSGTIFSIDHGYLH